MKENNLTDHNELSAGELKTGAAADLETLVLNAFNNSNFAKIFTNKTLAEKIYVFLSPAFVFSFVLFLALLSTYPVNAETTPKKNNDTPKKIEGVWRLSQTIRDKAVKQLLDKTEQLPPPFLLAPQSLILAADEALGEITINEAFKDVINTQTLPTDGTTVIKQIRPNEQISFKALWRNNELSIEALTPRGDKFTQIFKFSKDGKQLNVTMRLDDKRFSKSVVLKRIYNKTTEQLPVSDDSRADLNISQSPF